MNRELQLIAVAGFVAMAGFGPFSAAQAGSKSIDLPPDGVQLKPSALPGYAKARAICTACHSAE